MTPPRLHLRDRAGAGASEIAGGNSTSARFDLRRRALSPPAQIEPGGLSLADYDISFAAGPSALRVEHRLDGPVKCRAEPVAAKQVFSATPVELFTQEVNSETHNIVQVRRESRFHVVSRRGCTYMTAGTFAGLLLRPA